VGKWQSKLVRWSLATLSSLVQRNTLAFGAHLQVKAKMKCCQ